MKKYYMFNLAETKELFIGEFTSDNLFWKYYWENESEIKEKQAKLDKDCNLWHMVKF